MSQQTAFGEASAKMTLRIHRRDGTVEEVVADDVTIENSEEEDDG